MNIAADHIVRFHYTVFEDGGEQLETSRERGEPLAVMIGRGGLIAGLENALIGKSEGDTFEVTVRPAEGYGELREGFKQRVAKKYFRDAARLKPGMQTVLSTSQGPRLVTVLKVGASVIDVDLNHPMAGKTLKFNVEVVDVREATEEEKAHGHAHGPGGHQHD
ncbi:FKBP-type peptidyl-prolyl cis-trans isomerase [Pseudomarimonas arenosa]|uniref:Peptidyl-prolyl cis-trans isomerase n=1 Tax=Pseudomarimonas arenosa TaxID=2774145 RepID=A0AAW3ZEY4_9GAMM|nr:peptidylprolyl isomerase [Pseudomarimonas arenosa]MBD8524703.1 peptidylprolyl isomerase [Pseudomarimonas arenosa]